MIINIAWAELNNMEEFILDDENALGDTAIFARAKTAFLCSQKVPSAEVLKIYRWGQSVRDSDECIMSGFHTQLEGDIYDLLLNGKTCLVEVCARGLPKNLPFAKRELIERGHLLLVSPFIREKRRQTKAQAHARNIFVLRQAQKVVIGYATPQGRLHSDIRKAGVEVTYL